MKIVYIYRQPRQGAISIENLFYIGNYLFGLKGWKRWVFKIFWFKLPIALSNCVTAVSQTTRSHLIEHMHIKPECIEVVDNCYNAVYKPSHKDFNKDLPTIIQVGTKPYKNVPRLIMALSGISCCLILVGELDPEIISALNYAKIDFKNFSNISSGALLNLYDNADIVSFVSIGEGFGIPIIEAQAMGKPLITSNIPPMSMVAGEGACLANPLDINSIKSRIIQIIEDDNYRDNIINMGLINAVKYSPKVISRNYLNLYRRMMKICKK